VLGGVPAVRRGAGMEARCGGFVPLGGGLVAEPEPERARDAWDMDWGLVKGAELGEVGVAPR